MARDTAASALESGRAELEPAKAEPKAKAKIKASADAKAWAPAASVVDWERLWLAIQRSSWMSIALVPIGEGISTVRIAAALADVGRQHLGGKIVVDDATRVSLATLQASLSELIDRADRAIVALSPLSESPAGVEIARAADAVVLCLSLGESTIAEAERIMHDVGREHVIGAVIVRERKVEP